MPQTGEITIGCKCGKRLKAPATAVGRKAKCPNCGNVVTITAPPPPVAKSSSPVEATPAGARRLPFESIPENTDETDANEALYHLADKEAAAAEAAREAPPEDRTLCPKCMRVMSPGGVLCMNCGYDARTGAVCSPARGVTVETESDSTGGSMMRGLALCVAAAVVASAIWLMIAFASRGDRYFLAILIGVAAGFGMKKGLKDDSLNAGAIAGVVALVVSIVARVLVMMLVLIPAENRRLLGEHKEKQTQRAEQEEKLKEQELDDRDDRVAEHIARQELKSQGIDIDKDHDEDDPAVKKIEAAQRRAELKLRGITREEYEKYLPPIEQEDIRQTLISSMYDPQLRKMGLNPDFQRVYPEQSEAAQKAVLEAVSAMTPQQMRDEMKQINPSYFSNLAAEKQRAKNEYTLAPRRPDELKSKTVDTGEYVMSKLSGFGAILFTLLAAAAAFRTASGSLIA